MRERRNEHTNRSFWSKLHGERRLDARALLRWQRLLAVAWGVVRLSFVITLAWIAAWHFLWYHELPIWFKKLLSMD